MSSADDGASLSLVGQDFRLDQAQAPARMVFMADRKFVPTTRAVVPAWSDVVRDKLKCLEQLNPGWDSYNGQPIRSDTANFVLVVLCQVMTDHSPIPEIVPLPDGGIQLEWHEGNRDVELAIEAPYRCGLWYRDPRTMEAGSTPINRGDFGPLVEQLNLI